MIKCSMNFKSFELSVVILFTLLFIITFMIFNALHGKFVRRYFVCFRLRGIYVFIFGILFIILLYATYESKK